MSIDKSWTKLKNRTSLEFMNGLRNFIEIAKKHVNSSGKVRSPCVRCVNKFFETTDTVYAHIHDRGFHRSYDTWIHHGEKYPTSHINNVWGQTANASTTNEMFDAIEDVIAEQNTNEENLDEGVIGVDQEFDAFFEELNTELYPGCDWMSSLHFLAKLLHIKVNNKWTDSSFNQLLELLRLAFPKENKIPNTHYEAKKKLKKIGLGYQSIHACKNDCCLFWKENASADRCPICKESRWAEKKSKGSKVPQKVLRYFPLTSRLRRKYSSRHTAKDMTWHSIGSSNDGMMRHPVDGKAWKEFDKRHPEFSKEPRNIRLGLAADGFNPFGHMNQAHSTWPVVITTYNTPPWLCMKESSFMLTLLIPGPKSPGKDIDIFLRPLVDELKTLWVEGVQVRDASTNTVFRMRAALLWTINDYPARSSLSGWSGQGYKACPTCNEDTPSCRVYGKTAYVGHRRFLASGHHWRTSLLFNGETETRDRPRRFSNKDILNQLDRLPYRIPGKHLSHGGVKRQRNQEVELNWTKRSIFFELPYWSSINLKHNLDVMHIEKNVCESLLSTFLMNDKSKDTDKARLDLEKLGIRSNLWLQKKNNKPKPIRPPPPYSFTKENRKRFCQFIRGVRLPDGFGSNFKKKVTDDDTNIIGLKSHDYHILMQRLLPVGVRAYLNKDVSATIIDLCTFFKKICARNLVVKDMVKAQKELINLLCKLELIFPPAFFDIMIHLVLHLPEEAIFGGPVYMRWMYPFERYMKTLKNYVRNKAKPEGSIAEGYVADEALTFCSMYLEGVQTKFNRPDRNEDDGIPERQLSVFSSQCRPITKKKITVLPQMVKKPIEWYVLNNCSEIESYIEEFKSKHPGSDPTTEFSSWFRKKVYHLRQERSPECTDELVSLAHGSLPSSYTYTGCIVNGVRFMVHSRDVQRTTQNSGVVVPGLNGSLFYGQLEEILELNYLSGFLVVLFRCKWFKTSKGRINKKNNIVSINVESEWENDQQYILATQAKQVFYLQDPSQNNNWRVVEDVHHRTLWDHPSIDVNNEIDVVHNTCSSDFELNVDLGDLPMVTNLCEIGEASMVDDNHVAPIFDDVVEDESLIDDEDKDADTCPTNDEEEISDDEDDDDLEDKYRSSDDSD